MIAKFAGLCRNLLLLGLFLQAAAGRAHGESDEGVTWLAIYQGGAAGLAAVDVARG